VRLVCVAAVFLLTAGVARAGVDLPVPHGTRASDRAGVYVSGAGFRPTVDAVAKGLDRRGLTYRQVGPYRSHGVDVVRFVAPDARGPWLAVHVWRADGKTWISFVKRPP